MIEELNFSINHLLFRSEKYLNNKHSLRDFNRWWFPYHNNSWNGTVFPIHVRFSYTYSASSIDFYITN